MWIPSFARISPVQLLPARLIDRNYNELDQPLAVTAHMSGDVGKGVELGAPFGTPELFND
jgi:hypothetical protein